MKKLMIVEDEAVIAMQLDKRLRSMGYDVVGTVSTAEESVRMAKELNPNLILMDIVMPGNLDGINAAEMIKDEMDIPIVFLTAYTDDIYINRAKCVGPYGYIVKPFTDNDVKVNVEVALHKREMELKQKEACEKIRNLFRSVDENPWMIMIMDTKLNIEYINKKFSRITGFESSEIAGKNISLLEYDEMSPEVYKKVWEKISAGKEWKGELCIRKKDGAPYRESTFILPVKDMESEISLFVVVMDSVTDYKKRMEKLILQSEKLDAMRTMTTGITHEFNNVLPLSVEIHNY